ncbi:MAG: hypothetical protein AAF728_20670, partial [Cyanobacteria bacterium P01_D01_bin.128]
PDEAVMDSASSWPAKIDKSLMGHLPATITAFLCAIFGRQSGQFSHNYFWRIEVDFNNLISIF